MPQYELSTEVIEALKEIAKNDISGESLGDRIEDVASWGNHDDTFDAGVTYGCGHTARWILDELGIE